MSFSLIYSLTLLWAIPLLTPSHDEVGLVGTIYSVLGARCPMDELTVLSLP